MDDFKQQLIKFLWSKFFVDIDLIVKGLEAFGPGTRIDDDFETAVGEYYDRICSIVEQIEQRCPLYHCDAGEQAELSQLCAAITNAHIELRLQRDAIWQAHLKGVSEQRYREVFKDADIVLAESAKRARAALNSVFDHLTSVRGSAHNPPEI